jgi:hypothetical protein
MKQNPRLVALDEATRKSFCKEVLERMSDLVEDEAPEDFCERVIELLGDCPCYESYRDTLEATIVLANECGKRGPETPMLDDATFDACIMRVKEQLGT